MQNQRLKIHGIALIILATVVSLSLFLAGCSVQRSTNVLPIKVEEREKSGIISLPESTNVLPIKVEEREKNNIISPPDNQVKQEQAEDQKLLAVEREMISKLCEIHKSNNGIIFSKYSDDLFEDDKSIKKIFNSIPGITLDDLQKGQYRGLTKAWLEAQYVAIEMLQYKGKYENVLNKAIKKCNKYTSINKIKDIDLIILDYLDEVIGDLKNYAADYKYMVNEYLRTKEEILSAIDELNENLFGESLNPLNTMITNRKSFNNTMEIQNRIISGLEENKKNTKKYIESHK